MPFIGVDFGCACEAGMVFAPAHYYVEFYQGVYLQIFMCSYQIETQTCRGLHLISSFVCSTCLLTLAAHLKLEWWSTCI